MKKPEATKTAEEIGRLRRSLPSEVVEALQSTITAAHQFGSASGRSAQVELCASRLEVQREAELRLLKLLLAAFTKSYETGIEEGRRSVAT